jgi:hypothetical protein
MFLIACKESTAPESLINTKINKFYPNSGYSNSLLTIYGSNMMLVASVQFGNKDAQIMYQSADSLIVKVPNIPFGNYIIKLITCPDTLTLAGEYEIKYKLYLEKYNQFNCSINNFTGLYKQNRGAVYLDTMFQKFSYKKDTIIEKPVFSLKYMYGDRIILNGNGNIYSYEMPRNTKNSMWLFAELDSSNKLFKSIILTQYLYEGIYINSITKFFKLSLANVPVNISNNGEITFSALGNKIKDYLQDFQFIENNSWNHTDSYTYRIDSLIKLYDFSDSSAINLSISK